MIITVSELGEYIDLPYKSNQVIETMIAAAESFIRKYTNNDFRNPRTGEVEYPADVKMGAINMLAWDVNFREKSGIASETISRHSVSYSDQKNNTKGYPDNVISFLHPYMKARF